MKKALGVLAGLGLLALAMGAARTSLAGWDAGRSDVGFWWTVIASLLLIASMAALIGTAVHSRASE